MATLDAQQKDTQATRAMQRETAMNRMVLKHEQDMDNLGLLKEESKSNIDSNKFEAIIGAVGTDTLKAICTGSMSAQNKLLAGLGLKGYLLTDGKTPVNLFTAAQGMLGNPANRKSA
jgi:major vault protein